MLTKTKNIRKYQKKKKKEKNTFSKIQKRSERMAQGKPQIKFETNPCIKFRDKCYTDGRKDDGRRTNCDFMSSADVVKQS